MRRSAAGTDASDADLAVLEHQLDTEERLAADEMRDVVRYDADAPLERARSRDAWRIVQERIAGSPIDRLRANGVGIVGSC